MTDFGSTIQGDFDLADGDLVPTASSDALGQHVVHRLRTFESEWFLNLDVGVPYYRDILVKRPNPVIVDGILKQAILNSPGVLELLEFDLEYDNATRKLTVSFSVQTVDGVFEAEEEFG